MCKKIFDYFEHEKNIERLKANESNLPTDIYLNLLRSKREALKMREYISAYLSNEEKRLLILRYKLKLPISKVIQILNISKNSYYAKHKKIIDKIIR